MLEETEEKTDSRDVIREMLEKKRKIQGHWRRRKNSVYTAFLCGGDSLPQIFWQFFGNCEITQKYGCYLLVFC